jgi:hypothetical protein
VDGGSLYESFASNAVTNTDPMGADLGATGTITAWHNDEATAKIEIWSNPPGWWHRSLRTHNVTAFALALERDIHTPGDPVTRVWVTLGDRQYLVNLQLFRHWVQSGIHTELSTGSWGTANPSMAYLSAVLGRSFLEHFRGQIYGILDLTTGNYLPGFDPDEPENIYQSRTALQSGVRQAGATIEAGFKDVMCAFAAAALTEAAVGGARLAKASRTGMGPVARGGALPGQKGAAAEIRVAKAIGIPRNVGRGRVTIPSATGAVKYRVPDFGPAATVEKYGAVIEVKGVTRLSYTKQLQDLMAEAQSRGAVLRVFTNAPLPTSGGIAKIIKEQRRTGKVMLEIVPIP